MPDLPGNPLNQEPNIQDLIRSFITDEGYDRNHSLQPDQIDASAHRVRVDGAVAKILELSISDLTKDFPQHDVVCTLQCAGNRRHTMRTTIKEVQGIDWFDGAVMNCRWRGPLLKDVLEKAELRLSPDEQRKSHVAFASFVQECQDDTWYGASIPLERAMREDAEIILALERNGKPLSVRHGFPVRVVTPGLAGARSVKWLDRITVQTEESSNFYMQHDYKALPPEAVDAQSAAKFWHVTPAVQDMPVNSVVALPITGATVQAGDDGTILCEGYALPHGEDGPVVKVEVSCDAGETWMEAELLHHEQESKWSWMFWRARIPVTLGKTNTIFSRATDAGGNTQPREPVWNLRGVCYDGYGEARDLKIT